MMNHRLPSIRRAARRAGLAIAAFAWALLPAIAFAQGAAAPQPSITRSPNPIIGYGIMALLLIVVVAISFMPSKRGHQD